MEHAGGGHYPGHLPRSHPVLSQCHSSVLGDSLLVIAEEAELTLRTGKGFRTVDSVTYRPGGFRVAENALDGRPGSTVIRTTPKVSGVPFLLS